MSIQCSLPTPYLACGHRHHLKQHRSDRISLGLGRSSFEKVPHLFESVVVYFFCHPTFTFFSRREGDIEPHLVSLRCWPRVYGRWCASSAISPLPFAEQERRISKLRVYARFRSDVLHHHYSSNKIYKTIMNIEWNHTNIRLAQTPRTFHAVKPS